MTEVATSTRSGRRLNARGRARRAQREAAKRRRRFLYAGGALGLILAAPLSFASLMGVEAKIPGVQAAKSFLSMMGDRSPGDRTKAELIKTKHRAAPPHQRALGKITKPEPPKEFVEAIAPPLPSIAELPPVATVASLGPILLTPPPPPGGGGIIIPPPPGGGGGPPPPPQEPLPPPPPPPPPPPAVPEPSTWATMLLGFGLSGWMIRRRRRSVAALLPG